MTLIIGTIAIPFESGQGLDVQQTYERLGPRKIMRARSGSGRMAARWTKLKSTITGNFWLPPGLSSISEQTAVAVSCVSPLCAAEADTSITLVGAFRTDGDYAPQAVAIVNGEMVTTSISIVGQVCTLGAVSGATQYQVIYYPVITGFVKIKQSHNADQADGSWTIEVEEQ